MKKYKKGWLVAAMVLLVCLATVSAAPMEPKVTVTFTWNWLDSAASGQYAVWIEDSKGNYITTLEVTRFAAKKGFSRNPEVLPVWVKASQWAAKSQREMDAVTTATPGSDTITLDWDCRDKKGQLVKPGLYTYKVEGNTFRANRVLWTGSIMVGRGSAQSAATAEYFPNQREALKKGEMISQVAAEYREIRE